MEPGRLRNDASSDVSAFLKDLEGKAYALVNGSIELEDFKSWYKLAVVAAASSKQADAVVPEPAPFILPPRVQRFTDYARDIDEPDEETRAHHRKLLGSGSED